jgi:hypothetical protein
VPLSSHAEQAMHLAKVIGTNSHALGHSILPGEWLQTCFIQAIDLERASSNPSGGLVALTGLDSRTPGDTIRLSWDNVHPYVTTADGEGGVKVVRDAGAYPERTYVTIHHDLVIELRSEGVLLLS